MYLPSSEQCNAPNGQTPIDPASYAASNVGFQAQTQALAKANSQWQGVLRRDWRSFSDLGPQVAFQVMNAPVGSLAPAVFNNATPANTAGGGASGSGTGSGATPAAPPSPVGVQIVSPGQPGSSSGGSGSGFGPGSGGSNGVVPITAGRRRPLADSARVRITKQDASAFVNTFGPNLSPFRKYTGPLPPQGTAMSLTYGGSPSNRPASVGTAPPSMPQASAGYFQGASCPGAPGGVASLPWGEPDYAGNGGAAGGSAGALPSSWWMWGLLGLGIVGLAWADKSDKKYGRTKL